MATVKASSPVVYLAYLYHPGTSDLLHAIPTFYLDRALSALSDHFTEFRQVALLAELNEVQDVEFRDENGELVAVLGWMSREDEEPFGQLKAVTGRALLKAALRQIT